MKYLVELPPDLAKRVYALITYGKYENLSQFAVAAFENQLLLEGSSMEMPLDLIKAYSNEKKPIEQIKLDIDSLVLRNFSSEKLRVVETPSADKVPNDCLWGQYNRIFPVKITLRVLANLLDEKEKIELETLQSYAVQAAREIGLALRKEDKKSGRKYGDMLSSALPIGHSRAKTENRFINHFVGYYTRAGRIEGAPAALKFINIFEDLERNHEVGITQTGLAFASITNPVLDEKTYSTTLSKAESSFYIENVFRNLKREAEIMLEILRAVGTSNSSPTELNAKIASFSRGWSQAMTNTIRAGVIGRLHELGLISREREDVRVTYFLTSYGKETLTACEEKYGGS